MDVGRGGGLKGGDGGTLMVAVEAAGKAGEERGLDEGGEVGKVGRGIGWCGRGGGENGEFGAIRDTQAKNNVRFLITSTVL